MADKDYCVSYRNPQVCLRVSKMYYTVTKNTMSFLKIITVKQFKNN